jgi:hypothetical protein
MKLAILGFEGPIVIPHWIIFVAGGAVGAFIALYATSSKP